MRLKPTIFVLLSLFYLSLNACSIHPDYVKPKLQLPEKWETPIPHAGDVNRLNNWWAQLNDPTLDTLLKASQTDNPTLEKAIASIQLARANVQTARGGGFPSLNGNASDIKSKSANPGGSGNVEIQQVRTDASWEPDLFGRVKSAKEAAKARLESNQLTWHQARISLAAEVASSYINYRACVLKVDALQTALGSKQETAKITQTLSDAGFSAPADALLSSASAKSTESELVNQQAQCDLEIKALVSLSNLSDETIRTLLSETTGLPIPTVINVTTVPANLLVQRPDLVADERNLAAASADIGIAKADLYPSISLNGSIGYQKTVFNDFIFQTNTWSFGPSINLPIFDGGQRKAQVKVAEANFLTALANYKQHVRDAVKEVEVALVNLNSASKRTELEATSFQQFTDYFQAAQFNWRAGGLDLLALEDARRQMINAQTSLITQQQNRVLYWIALYKAFGGDWQSNQINKTKVQ
jgi:multidrug efflux system outer membrane protein